MSATINHRESKEEENPPSGPVKKREEIQNSKQRVRGFAQKSKQENCPAWGGRTVVNSKKSSGDRAARRGGHLSARGVELQPSGGEGRGVQRKNGSLGGGKTPWTQRNAAPE